MAIRASKCAICGISDKEPKITEKQKRYHEGQCYEIHKKQQEFKDKERQQKDELTEKLMEIHGFKNTQEIPKLFWMKLEEVRNDSGTLGKVNKRYKAGIPYNALSYTYDFVREKIDYWLKSKTFDTKLGEMYYCFAIVQNSVVDAYNDAVRKKNAEKQQEQIKQQTTIKDMSLETHTLPTKKEKKDEMDISHLL